jgi:hypothetical protein
MTKYRTLLEGAKAGLYTLPAEVQAAIDGADRLPPAVDGPTQRQPLLLVEAAEPRVWCPGRAVECPLAWGGAAAPLPHLP